MKGILLVDKPAGMTSHDIVDRVRKAAGIRRVGHTGTLDPNATGLLILCLGQATRLSEHLTGLDKVYEGVMRLGIETDSYDIDGVVVAEMPTPVLTVEELQAACSRYEGELQQLPPMVSAVRVGGERLYRKARKGELVERSPRTVHVQEFKVLGCDLPDVQVRVRCTRGTYVRSLCHDVGQDLGCGAILASLRRIAVGRHHIDAAVPLDALQTREDVEKHLAPMGEALDMPAVVVSDRGRAAAASGLVISPVEMRGQCPVTEGWVQVKDEHGALLALGEVEATAMGARVHPRRVLMS